MKTTVIMEEALMTQLKREAARRGKTMSELMETAVRLLLSTPLRKPKLRPLPKFKSGGHLVNIDDRDALYDALEGR